MKKTIDLNADLGEGFPWDEALLARVSSASICCGAHAGDDQSMRRAIAIARTREVTVGAHPGYVDREHFGRKEQDVHAGILRDQILTQVERMGLLAIEEGVIPRFIKPHGALYNQAQVDHNVATAVVSAAQVLRLPLVGQAGTLLETLAQEAGVRLVREGFLDRRYGPEGRLVPREQPGALIDSPAEILGQLGRLLEEQQVETLCLHGDRQGAVELADLVLEAIAERGMMIQPFLKPV